MEEKYSSSPYAVYFIGLSWIVYGIFFPLYKLAHLITALVISVAAYILFSKILPKKVTLVEKPALIALSDDKKINELIISANESISAIRKANALIPDKALSAHIARIEELTTKIFDFVIEHPSELSSIRRFINYYLPTTLKLLNTYITLSDQNINEPNVAQSIDKIEDMLITIVKAFEKQLDSLFAYTALDVSAEISAMEGILTSEGLIKTDELKSVGTN